MPARQRILIVEDDPVVKHSLNRLLSSGNCEVESASSAEEGLQKFRHHPFDLVLTDLKLPGLDGMEMIQQMRDIAANLPFIILSAFTEGSDRRRAERLGAGVFFSKPFDAAEVLAAAQNGLSHHLTEPNHLISESVPTPTESHMNPENVLSPIEFTNDYDVHMVRMYSHLAPFVSIGRHSGGVVHNLVSPLTGIIGNLDLLKIKHAELYYEVGVIMGLAKKMQATIVNLSTKFERETQPEVHPQDINEILRTELAFLQADLFFKHDVQVTLDLQPLPKVIGIYSDFSLTFEELLRNAIDAQRSQRAGWLGIRTFAGEQAVYVEFADEGPGFTLEALEHAFDPFWPSVKTQEDGVVHSGMGLYLSRLWLEPYSGEIELRNRTPRGAQVTVTLPFRGRGNQEEAQRA